MNLSDLEIIMKVTDDLWSNIEGYGKPIKDIMGYLRLDFLDENGVGVCRNISDDFTAKMNAINIKYNARNLVVYSDYQKLEIANIERNFVEQENSTIQEEEKIDLTKIFGNHMVTLIDIPEENITLVIDPTNPAIGIYIDGNIYILNESYKESIKTKFVGELVYGSEMFFNYAEAFATSFFSNNSSLEEINGKYGLEAQNEALYYVRNCSINDNYIIDSQNILDIKKLKELKIEILNYQNIDLIDSEKINILYK